MAYIFPAIFHCFYHENKMKQELLAQASSLHVKKPAGWKPALPGIIPFL
jgi:hypothetical protein